MKTKTNVEGWTAHRHVVTKAVGVGKQLSNAPRGDGSENKQIKRKGKRHENQDECESGFESPALATWINPAIVFAEVRVGSLQESSGVRCQRQTL